MDILIKVHKKKEEPVKFQLCFLNKEITLLLSEIKRSTLNDAAQDYTLNFNYFFF